MSHEAPTFCDRCVCQLTPGSGDFFEVHIRAVADPSPPVLQEQDEQDTRDLRRRYEELVDALNDVSPQEAMDQVQRQLTIYLCNDCYREWIENPTGRVG